jgi:hypothetical protein
VARAHDGEVLFFGVAWKASEDECRAFVDEFDVPYESGLDADESVFRAFKVGHQPATVFIAKNGAITRTHHGPITSDELERSIDQYL